MTRRLLASAVLAGAALTMVVPAVPASADNCGDLFDCLLDVPCIQTPDTIICFEASA